VVRAADDVGDRLLGVAPVMWNQPRSVTLVAGPAGCTLLLLKRKALSFLVAEAAEFREQKMQAFIAEELPGILAENRLFGHKLYADDVADASWPLLAGLLRGKWRGSSPAAARRIRERVAPELRHALADLDRPGRPSAADRDLLLAELNRLLRL